MKESTNEIFQICNGITYNREVPKEAIEIAKNNNTIIIVGGSDDLMMVYGIDCYMTKLQEHDYGWDGDDLKNIEDKKLEEEATQLGLKIFWSGKILKTNENFPNYDFEKIGSFSYLVKENIEFKNFKVYEDESKEEIYCTGIIIELPNSFSCSK
jgi:hypothetical protein